MIDRLVAILHFIITVAIFFATVLFLKTDFNSHSEIWLKCMQHHFLPANFLYYILLGAATLFTNQYDYLLLAAPMLMAIFFQWRYNITRTFFRLLAHQDNAKYISLACLMLSFTMCVPNILAADSNYYRGLFPANLWHNPTIIVAFPFTLLLFYYSFIYLSGNQKNILFKIGFYAAMVVIAKPNFTFVWIPAFGLFSLWRFGFTASFWRSLLPCISTATFISLMYLWVFHHPDYDRIVYGFAPTHLRFEFFDTWHLHSGNITIAIILSLLFPLSVYVAFFQSLKQSILWNFAWLLLFFGVLIAGIIGETGARTYHFNFSWQLTACNYILQMLGIGQLLAQKTSIKQVLLMFFFCGQFAFSAYAILLRFL